MIARLTVRLNLEAFSDSVNDLLMLFHGLRWDWPPLEREHSGTVGLVHDRFGDSRDATIPATCDEKTMKFIVSLGPRYEVILLQGKTHQGIQSIEGIGFDATL